MNLFENIFMKRNKEPRIKISKENINDYSLISINGENFPHKLITSLYLNVIKNVFSDYPSIAVSQFIDESQGMLKDKCALFERLSAFYKVEVILTRKYDSINQPSKKDTEYIVNMLGSLNTDWLNETLRYGGTCLSNIIYGFCEFSPDWLERLIERNKLFVKWYQLEVDRNAIIPLLDQAGVICFTSDSYLECFVKDTNVEKIMHELQEYTQS
ncbi:MAG: hypothetical protein ABFD14_12100 [Anaerolineaceae bacterium]